MVSSLRDAASRAPSPAGRILAIDYGRRRIGLAVSDELGLTARPLATLTRINRRNVLPRLREIVRAHEVCRILVGHPVRLGGTAGVMAEETEKFALRLAKGLGIPVELVDERLTSWEAGQIAGQVRRSPRTRQASTDQVAAAVILREYLEREATDKRRHAKG